MSLNLSNVNRTLVRALIFALTFGSFSLTTLAKTRAQSTGEATQTSAPFLQVDAATPQPETNKQADVVQLNFEPSSLTRVLAHPSAQKDIGLVEEQRQRLDQIKKEFQPKLNELLGQAQQAAGKGLVYDAIVMKIRQLNEQLTNAMRDELLPHQLQRVEQIENQLHLNRFGVARGLGVGKLGRTLNVTEAQANELEAIQLELRKQILEKTLELKKAARKKSLQVLSSKQRTKLKTLVGDGLAETNEDWDEHFQRQKLKKANAPSLSPAKQTSFERRHGGR